MVDQAKGYEDVRSSFKGHSSHEIKFDASTAS